MAFADSSLLGCWPGWLASRVPDPQSARPDVSFGLQRLVVMWANGVNNKERRRPWRWECSSRAFAMEQNRESKSGYGTKTTTASRKKGQKASRNAESAVQASGRCRRSARPLLGLQCRDEVTPDQDRPTPVSNSAHRDRWRGEEGLLLLMLLLLQVVEDDCVRSDQMAQKSSSNSSVCQVACVPWMCSVK